MSSASAPTPRLGSADPVRVDPKHYNIELENERVRVLRVKYGAHEKSVMHSHPACFAIFLTASRARFTFPDGKSEERSWNAGDTLSMPTETHLPENLDDKPLEVVLIEFK